MTYDRYEPANGPSYAGLGSPVRYAEPVPMHIGPDTEGLRPGFHKQSNGMLMYVPDMQVIDAKPQATPGDIHQDASRPVGYYDTNFCSIPSVKFWHGAAWSNGVHERYSPGMVGDLRLDKKGMEPASVLRARPDLDALHPPLEGDPPNYDEPEGDSPEDEAPPVDLQVDATRPVGFYVVDNGGLWTKHWNGSSWSEGYEPQVCEEWAREGYMPHLLSMMKNINGVPVRKGGVLRRLPHLDAMVQK